MSIFGNILKKIFHPGAAQAAPQAQAAPAPTQPIPGTSAQQAQPAQPAPTAAPAAPTVDVGAVLEAMADMKADKGGNYGWSIVDLLKLLDLDSSLSARKELAEELGVHDGEHGTAEQNIALHRAVLDKLAANGGIIPDSMRA